MGERDRMGMFNGKGKQTVRLGKEYIDRQLNLRLFEWYMKINKIGAS